MSRPKTEPTTGKQRTDPPPYFLHDRSDTFYEVLETESGKYLARLKRLIHPSLKNKHLLLATAAGRMPELSPMESIAIPIRKDLGVGPVRAVYYRELVHGHYFREMMAHTYFAGRSHFVVGGRHRDPMEWLCMDRYLAKTLMSLGISWWQVESAMVRAIAESGLPEQFLKRYGGTADVVGEWERHWTNRDVLAREGDASRGYRRQSRELGAHGEAAELLLSILNGNARDVRSDVDMEILEDGSMKFSSPTEFDRIINDVIAFDAQFPAQIQIAPADAAGLDKARLLRDYGLHTILMDSSDIVKDSIGDFPRYTTARRSPLVNSVIFKVGYSLWNWINTERTPRTAAALRLIERKRAWCEQGEGAKLRYYLPDEFYMLLADLLCHCPVVCGLPDDHLLRTASRAGDDDRPKPPMWEGLTAVEVRQRFGRLYRQHCTSVTNER
jgi:hypothetical protein